VLNWKKVWWPEPVAGKKFGDQNQRTEKSLVDRTSGRKKFGDQNQWSEKKFGDQNQWSEKKFDGPAPRSEDRRR